MKILAIIGDTFRELLVRKVLLGFVIVIALGLIGVGIFISRGSISMTAALYNKTLAPADYDMLARQIETVVMAFFYVILIFISIFTTASVLPGVMEKGTIDIYLSKPLARWQILYGKVLGSVCVIAACVGAFMLGAWVILSLRLGVWYAGFLGAGAVILFAYVVLYSIVVVFNVVTRTGVLGIIVAFVHFLALSGILAARDKIFAFLSPFWQRAVDGVYYVLPQTAEHASIAADIITGQPVASWLPLWDSALFAAAMFALAGWLFNRKDF